MSTLLKKYAKAPWMIWLLVVLSRQRKRQYWLKEIDSKIKASNLKRDGVVPDYPKWKYSYHGMGLILYGPNNEWLDVDFHDDNFSTIDPYFFTTRIFNFKISEAPEERLKQWFPEIELVILAIRELQGEVLKPKKSHVFRLADKEEADWLFFSSFDFTKTSNFKEFLLSVEGNDDQRKIHKINFERWLVKNLKNKKLSPSSFEAIVKSLPSDKRIKECNKKLKKIDHEMASAIKILSTVEEAPVKKVVLILKKLYPSIHHPYLAHTVCEFLLARGVEHENCISKLKSFSDIRKVKGYNGNPYDYDLAYLTLKYNPKTGVILLRRALRSSTPDSVKSAAVLMAAIDTKWSNKELVNVLKKANFKENPTNKRYIIAALLHSSFAKYRKIGEENILKSKVRGKNEFGWTWDERVENNMETIFNLRMQRIKTDLACLDLKRIKLAVSKESN